MCVTCFHEERFLLYHDEKFNYRKWVEKLVHQWLVFVFVISSHTAYPSMVQCNAAVQCNFSDIGVSTECTCKHHCSTILLLHVSNQLDTSPTIFAAHRTILRWSLYYSLLDIIAVTSIMFNRPFLDLDESTAWIHDILEIGLSHLHVHLHINNVMVRWAQDTQMFLVTRKKKKWKTFR